MRSISEEMAVFSLAGPQAVDSLALVGCSCPPPGRLVKGEFEGEKVNRKIRPSSFQHNFDVLNYRNSKRGQAAKGGCVVLHSSKPWMD